MGLLRNLADKAFGRFGYHQKAGLLPGADEGVLTVNPDGSIGPQVVPEDYLNVYGAHPWVYACVRQITAAAGQVAYRWYQLERDQGDGVPKRVAVPEHPLQTLLDRPNPYMTGIELRKAAFLHLELAGEAWWAMERDEDERAAELWPMRPDWVRIGVKSGLPVGVQYGNPNTPEDAIHYPWSDIVQLRYFDPTDMLRGLSPIQAASRSLTNDFQAIGWNTGFLKNSARPDGALVSEAPLDTSTQTALAAQWRKAHQGASRSHRVAILHGGLKWQTFGLTQKDMDWIAQRKLNREEVCAIFGVPPALVGLLEYANYSNMSEQRRHFWENTMMDRFGIISEGINLHLLAKCGFEATEGLFGAYDVSTVPALREAQRELMETYIKAIAAGLYTINDVRRRLNEPDLAWGDDWYGNMATVPIATQDGSTPVPTEQDVAKAHGWAGQLLGEPGWVTSRA
ncbi:MAG: phage portal protein [Armatimonadota bacterium]|jgi:HK97 family phage portal protein